MCLVPCTLYFVLVGQPQLGFSITDPFKAIASGAKYVGKTAYSAAQDTRVQRAAAAAAQAYAPGQYAQVTEYADRARGIFRPPGPQTPMQMPMPMMPPQAMPPMDDDGGPMPAPGGPVQKGNLLTIGALVGAGLIVLLLLRK